MDLSNQLHGASSNRKGEIIKRWGETATIDSAMEGRDMRTSHDRTLQNRLAIQEMNSDFTVPRDEILDRLKDYKERHTVAQKSVFANSQGYTSPLYRRVFRDHRGPVVAIKEIRDLIAPLPENRCYQAILDWQPPT
ncbi:hypothetical protein GWC77_26380 [Paraburkholderia sp. NMBU_R16]|uniref:hypothetical protein n=1 Tax=Paraburkholderia sp. NMBU_R16 TaxID=2698676 RepID=UPI001566AA9D|nr:hypothetical protein [Paraburkholderia sp. NMBU_R16]NRO99414.1 hypothetical protein [Paraburkholderia sp. NMBU_R16]